MRVSYYGIYEILTGKLEVYHLVDISYQKMEPNDRGHYPIEPMQVELGLWRGVYQNQEMLWLRWWDVAGNLLLIGQEQVAIERQRTEQECQRADAAERELEELRSLLQQRSQQH